MNRIRLAGLLLVVLSGCSVAGNETKTSAFIDDGLTSRGFKIASVDEKVPTRWALPVATAVPYVLVEPGIRRFTTQGDSQSFTAMIEAGKHYRTDWEGNVPVLVETAADESSGSK